MHVLHLNLLQHHNEMKSIKHSSSSSTLKICSHTSRHRHSFTSPFFSPFQAYKGSQTFALSIDHLLPPQPSPLDHLEGRENVGQRRRMRSEGEERAKSEKKERKLGISAFRTFFLLYFYFWLESNMSGIDPRVLVSM